MSIKLPDKFLEKIEHIDQKGWSYIFAGALFLFFTLDYFLLMKPQLGTLMKINPEIKLLSDQMNRAKNDIQRLSFFREEIKRLNKDIGVLQQKVKTKDSVSQILKNISLIAESNGVKINQIMPVLQDQELLLESGENKYYFIPIQIEAKSGYHNFGRFINQLENQEPYLTLGIFSVTGDNEVKEYKIKLLLKAVVFD